MPSWVRVDSGDPGLASEHYRDDEGALLGHIVADRGLYAGWSWSDPHNHRDRWQVWVKRGDHNEMVTTAEGRDAARQTVEQMTATGEALHGR